ncbi:Plant self-incompatibility S1 [Macleaya cordata]|uniref:S-protein homolog n=1 Tax=Macleaya cordata TaxID=56857 RepID=A0A200R740_MACCD|nr:Plant self-incompatibility S1 [Macleaya cordata]OVA18542.1 Plant self-incompatibility S1 [Macleaya cordata]
MSSGRRRLEPPLSTSLFMFVLALSSNWCPSAYSTFSVNDWGERITVWVTNDLGPNTPLTFHCKSKDDDLGERTLAYKQSWNWSFTINFWWTTLFWCNMWWHDSNGQLVYASHDAYKAKRDYREHCRMDCFWSIRKDGWYYGDDAQSEKLMFTWDTTNQ